MYRQVSLSDVIQSDVPTLSSQYKRDDWLVSIGKRMRWIDVLGTRMPNGEYYVIPLSRVWDWDSDPYEPPMSGVDWWYVIQGMPESNIKDNFLYELAYGLTGDMTDEHIADALDQLRYSNLTLTFDTSINTFILS